MTRRAVALALFAAIVAVAVAGIVAREAVESRGDAARKAEPEQAAAAPGHVSRTHGEAVVTLVAATQRDDGIATAVLKNAPHPQLLRGFATVLDLQALTALANRYDAATAQLDIAQAKLAASRTAFERARKLYADRQSVSAAQREEAEAAFRIDQAGLMAAQSQRRTIAVTAEQDWGPVLGDAVVNHKALLQRLVGHQAVLLQVTLRPGQQIVQPPTDAVVRRDDGSPVALDFLSAATKTDPRLQGPSFFFTAAADGGLLPGMTVVALLPAGPPVEGAALPAAAIVWHDGRAWAYFRVGPDRFARRPVATDHRLPDGFYVAQGIADGTEIVVGGAQILLSEEFRAQTQAGGQGDTD